MAEYATPSAAKMSSINTEAKSPEPESSKNPVAKPEKPDEAAYKTALEKAKKELTAAQEATKGAQAKVGLARPGNKDSPTSQRQKELRDQLSSIKQKQQGLKTSRSSVQEKIKALDNQLKTRFNEQKVARSKIPYKSVDELDREIQRLEKQVDSGTMKLVDEKKTLTDITALRKQRKAFAGFDEAQKHIDDLKSQIAEIKKGLDDPESKTLSDQFAAAAKELDQIKAEQDSAFKGLNSSKEELGKARANQDQKYSALKAIQDKYYSDKRAYHEYDREAARQRQARQKVERDEYFKNKRREAANDTLQKASTPAYLDEIRSARSLLQRLDPTHNASTSPGGPGKFAASPQRTVDAGQIQGTVLKKKDESEENYFMGTGGKKGKKNRKPAAAADTASGGANSKADLAFFMSPGVLQELGRLEIDVPSSQSDIPATTEKIKEKLKFMQENQDRKTKENIDKAQKEIDRLEAEAHEDPEPQAAASSNTRRKPAAAKSTPNGATAAAGDEVSDATSKLAETTLESDPHSTNLDAAVPADEKTEDRT